MHMSARYGLYSRSVTDLKPHLYERTQIHSAQPCLVVTHPSTNRCWRAITSVNVQLSYIVLLATGFNGNNFYTLLLKLKTSNQSMNQSMMLDLYSSGGFSISLFHQLSYQHSFSAINSLLSLLYKSSRPETELAYN